MEIVRRVLGLSGSEPEQTDLGTNSVAHGRKQTILNCLPQATQECARDLLGHACNSQEFGLADRRIVSVQCVATSDQGCRAVHRFANNAVYEDAFIAAEGNHDASFDLFELCCADLNGIAGPERRPHAGAGDAKRSATIKTKCLDEELAFPAVFGVYDNLRLKRHCACVT